MQWTRLPESDAGTGAKGIGDTAMRNYDKWKEIRVQMDTIAENAPVDTSLKLFGKEFKYPFFRRPGRSGESGITETCLN